MKNVFAVMRGEDLDVATLVAGPVTQEQAAQMVKSYPYQGVAGYYQCTVVPFWDYQKRTIIKAINGKWHSTAFTRLVPQFEKDLKSGVFEGIIEGRDFFRCRLVDQSEAAIRRLLPYIVWDAASARAAGDCAAVLSD